MNEQLNTQSQQIAMAIIANSGEAKGYVFSALRAARDEKDIEKARKLLKDAEASITEAHKAQTELLTMSASGETVTMDVLMVHAQDHLMTTMVAYELVIELIEVLAGK